MKKKDIQRENKSSNDASTEEKIKATARRLFTKKGYSAVTTREIAAEAGINVALLNYYFRSKEKLFDIVMLENLQQFVKGVVAIINNEQTSLENKIELLADHYIEMLLHNPDIPLFILNEMRNDPEKLVKNMDIQNKFASSYLVKQIMGIREKEHLPPINPLHYLVNMLGLIIFPFIAAPIIQTVGHLNKDQYAAMMLDRKKLIPYWMNKILE